MRSDDGKTHLWNTGRTAVLVLASLGIVNTPPRCRRGHHWHPTVDGKLMHCFTERRREDQYEDDEEGTEIKRKQCNLKMIWRQKGSFAHELPSTLDPDQLCKAMFWFCENAPREIVVKETGASPKTITAFLNHSRMLKHLKLTSTNENRS